MRFFFPVLVLLSIHSVYYGQTTVFVKFKDSAPAQEIRNIVNQNAVILDVNSPGGNGLQNTAFLSPDELETGERVGRIVKLTFRNRISKNDVQQMVRYPDLIEYVEENKTLRMDAIPNDSLFSRQWGLAKIGVQKAWETTKGADTVLVGVIDTGIDFFHPDLKNQLFYNSGELGADGMGGDKKTNGVDDDHNGFVDDYMGWDFTDRTGFPYDSTGGDYLIWDNYPMDENVYSHGTAVAGIIGAQSDNLLGVSGVAPNVRLLNLRAFDPDGFGEEDDVAAAILYAVKMKAKVINMSFGDYSFSFVLRDVIRYAYGKNVVLVASAGNSTSSAPHYPSGYSEVISVGNSTSEDYVAGTSNYGSTLDLVAPGSGITTTGRNYSYSDFSGTSAAAPFVSAVAALIQSKSTFRNEEVKQIIKSTADDLGAPGWDERSGSGRLNAEKALRVLSPSVVKFEYPTQDFAASGDTIQIFASVLSPQFVSFSLYYGIGLNPTSWKILLENQKNQVSRKFLSSLNVASSNDTSLTLRIVLEQMNGLTIEERVNVHVIRKSPAGEAIVFPAYYGRVPTFSAAVVADQNTIVRMYYKRAGASIWRFISLDGFAMNNFFVKKAHYGFLPLAESEPSSEYEIYFELENLVGKKTYIRSSGGANFKLNTQPAISGRAFDEMTYSLPTGLIFNRTLPLSSASGKEILYNKFNDVSLTSVYSFNGNGFTLRDSLKQRIPKDAGDYNSDGKIEILSNWGRNLYISSQTGAGSTSFTDVYKKEDNASWPVFSKDIDGDGKQELIAFVSDTSFAIYEVKNDLSLVLRTTGKNFSSKGYGGNIFDYPHAQVADVDKDGKNELWVADSDGDVLCYTINSSSSLTPDTVKSFSTGFLTSSSYLQSGDFNGDGRTDLAIILQSIESLDIARFNLVYILSNINNRDTIIFAQAFIDPASEFSVFTRKTYNTLKFAKLGDSAGEDLVLAMFPYAYIFRLENGTGKPVFFIDNANANAIFTGDLNNNGRSEFAIPTTEKIRFFEFRDADGPTSPELYYAASISQTTVKLQWRSDGSFFYIYRAAGAGNPTLYDSTTAKEYHDFNVVLGKVYTYQLAAKNSRQVMSSPSLKTQVFHHIPAKAVSARATTGKKVEVLFSDRISSGVHDLSVFILRDSTGSETKPISVVASGDFSYLLSFSEKLADKSYLLRIGSMRDFYGSPVSADSFTVHFTSSPLTTELYVESYRLLDRYTVDLTFNLPLDTVSAQNIASYEFRPLSRVGEAKVSGNEGRDLRLRITSGSPLGRTGIESVLRITNIRSSKTTGFIPINEGAGGYVVFTGYAEDLSNAYAYPNPVKVIHGDETVTFAELPKYAEILIYSVTGQRLKVLNERDGNGGLSWDLKDENGEVLPSGIYYYLIRQLDQNNNEKEAKMFKFGVIR